MACKRDAKAASDITGVQLFGMIISAHPSHGSCRRASASKHSETTFNTTCLNLVELSCIQPFLEDAISIRDGKFGTRRAQSSDVLTVTESRLRRENERETGVMKESKRFIYSMVTEACVDKLLSIRAEDNQSTGVKASHQELQLAMFARQYVAGGNVIRNGEVAVGLLYRRACKRQEQFAC